MERFMLRKGAWTDEEDDLLKKCILKFGEGRWHQVPLKAGLNRCRKSCRMRWLNYLKPNIKRGEFKEDEVDLILKLHRLLGNRWSMIAGRIPGRTANDIKNYWNTHLKKKKQHHIRKSKRKIPIRSNINNVDEKEATSTLVDSNNNVDSVKTTVFKPRPRTFSKNSPWVWKSNDDIEYNVNVNDDLDLDKWWESLLLDKEDKVKYSEKCVANNNWWESLLLEEENYCVKENMVEYQNIATMFQ